MESAVGIVLKPLGLALEMGLHDDLRETKGWCREGEYKVWKEFVSENVKVEGS